MRAPRTKKKTAPVRAKISAAVAAPLVLSIGHSTRTIEEFIHLLQVHGATCVVDVRTFPRSRHNPQFNQDTLPISLQAARIAYVHRPALGGRRRAAKDSVNLGWRNTAFRGYADYMQTPEFQKAVEELIDLAKKDRIALMCAEAVPWRCHRSLIEDALLVRGVPSEDIMSETKKSPHKLTPFAKTRGTKITYPPEKVSASPPRRAGKSAG
jgi:uncharacterized protein (DUF488 family)